MPLTVKTSELPALTGFSVSVSVALLREQGVYPIDIGPGRGRGCHWYVPAVEQAIAEMHKAAQPTRKATKLKRPAIPTASLAGMSAAEIFHLTQGHRVQ